MKIALIGLEQAGKKTLFHLLTGKKPPEVRKPGEVLEGMATIRDERVDELARVCSPKKTTYAQNHFVLCPDAAAGSYEWLSEARRCQLICIVARAFESDQLYHPAGSVDPVRDCDNLEAELLLADMEIIENRLARLEKESRTGLRDEQKREQEALKICLPELEAGKRLCDITLEDYQLDSIRSLDFVTLLPLLRVYNVSEDDLDRDCGEGRTAVSCKIEQ
jgi:ribosome-binding ATPase YchF (GTP1/OBG family)